MTIIKLHISGNNKSFHNPKKQKYSRKPFIGNFKGMFGWKHNGETSLRKNLIIINSEK